MCSDGFQHLRGLHCGLIRRSDFNFRLSTHHDTAPIESLMLLCATSSITLNLSPTYTNPHISSMKKETKRYANVGKDTNTAVEVVYFAAFIYRQITYTTKFQPRVYNIFLFFSGVLTLGVCTSESELYVSLFF